MFHDAQNTQSWWLHVRWNSNTALTMEFSQSPVMNRTRAIVLASCAVMIALSVVFWASVSQAPSDLTNGVRVSLVGGTNDSTGKITAVLSISNCTKRTIVYWPPLPQARKRGVWPVPSHPAVGTPLLTLDAGQNSDVSITPPADAEAWRVPVVWILNPTKAQIAKQRLKDGLDSISRGSWPSWHVHIGLYGFTNYSAEIVR